MIRQYSRVVPIPMWVESLSNLILQYDNETAIEYQRLVEETKHIVSLDHPDFFKASAYGAKREIDKKILINVMSLAQQGDANVQS